MTCKERLTMHTPEGACLIINTNNETDAQQELMEKFKLACNKLAELEDKLENGTMIELPCKLGTKVFEMNSYYDCKIDAFCECHDFSLRGEKACICCENNTKKNVVNTSYFNLNMRDRIGKTVFLTKEEAEARLKELQNG